MHTPAVLLLGYTNVGKSTLFNALLGRKAAIVYDRAGVTRDCRMEQCQLTENSDTILLIDSPGIENLTLSDTPSVIINHHEKILKASITSADIILYVTDAISGITQEDIQWIRYCQKSNKRIIACINKVDSDRTVLHPSVYTLGAEHTCTLSAKTKEGVAGLKQHLGTLLKEYNKNHTSDLFYEDNIKQHQSDEPQHSLLLQTQELKPLVPTQAPPTLMLIGKPNVGKSTLTNQLAGQAVSTATHHSGTTRDIVKAEFTWSKKRFTLLDTAGIRRQVKVHDPVEKLALSQVFQALKSGVDAIAFLIDAQDGFSDQDYKLIRLILESRTRVCIVCNKWDLLSHTSKAELKYNIQHTLQLFPTLPVVYISASKRECINKLMKTLTKILATSSILPTSHLTRILYKAIADHPPPTHDSRRIKPRFAHSVGRDYRIVITGNQVEILPQSYRRYLTNYFQKHLGILGINLELLFKNKSNPYDQVSSD